MSKNILGIFDGSDIEGITALIESLEQSSFDYLKLEGDGIAITIGKNGAGEAAAAALQPAASSVPAAAEPIPPAAASEPAPVSGAPAAIPEEKAEAAGIAEQEDTVIIRSPSYGLFYAQSEPGAPPYVKLGDTVKKGDTVGLLEIMKTFNAITSPEDGEIAAVFVQNGETLEPEQPLMSIRVK